MYIFHFKFEFYLCMCVQSRLNYREQLKRPTGISDSVHRNINITFLIYLLLILQFIDFYF